MASDAVLAETAGTVTPAAPPAPVGPPGDIVDLVSTSEVFVPPRGRAYQKFSSDFPEPSVVFGDYRFGFLVFTDENTTDSTGRRIAPGNATRCNSPAIGFVWAGGQENAPGKLDASLHETAPRSSGSPGRVDRPIKTVSTVVRGVPRGACRSAVAVPPPERRRVPCRLSLRRRRSQCAGSMDTPIAHDSGRQPTSSPSRRSTPVRPKRFFLQPGETASAWRRSTSTTPGATTSASRCRRGGSAKRRRPTTRCTCTWRTSSARSTFPRGKRAPTSRLDAQHRDGDDAARHALHRLHVQRLREACSRFCAGWRRRFLAIACSCSSRRGTAATTGTIPTTARGSDGRRGRIQNAHRRGSEAGFKMMPMFGMNSANKNSRAGQDHPRRSPRRLTGTTYNLNWVGPDNDRHQDGWLGYINLGADSWRNRLESRIADMIDRYGVDAYFLDIAEDT